MADHPKCCSKVTQRTPSREDKQLVQSSSTKAEESVPPTCSKRPTKRATKEKQQKGTGKSSNSGVTTGVKKPQPLKITESKSPPSKKKKSGITKKVLPSEASLKRNLSSSSRSSFLSPDWRQSSEHLSSSDSNEELNNSPTRLTPPPSDKRSSLRSNPRASLLEGLDFPIRRRSSTKGKATPNKTPVKSGQSPSTSQRLGKKRTHSETVASTSTNEEQPKETTGHRSRVSGPFKIRIPPLQSSQADPGPSSVRATRTATSPTYKPTEGRKPSTSKNQRLTERSKPTKNPPGESSEPQPGSSKRKRGHSAVRNIQEATSGGQEEVAVKRRKTKSGAGVQKKSKQKPSGSTQLNTGSCASSRRRAAPKEGVRLRASSFATTSSTITLTTAGVIGNNLGNSLPGASNTPSQMSNSEDRQFFGIGNSSGSAPGDTSGDVSGSIPDHLETGTSANNAGSLTSSLGLDQDSDVGRLQALLEARGVPSHLFGALGPRMHQILQRSVLGNSVYKVQVILQNLQSKDENQQLSAAIEMCQLLVMGNEDTLAGFPTRQVVPALINLLKNSHIDEMTTNFDVMHHACRALTYMMEALPRSSAVVVDAVPVFLEKLQSIQCMDVAEQALQALEMLSKKHHKAILQANGVSSCLTFLDFFSLPAQRTALSITANCCQNLTADEFHFVRTSLPTLANLLTQQDKKLLESVCLSMSRLVENFHSDGNILREVAADGFLHNILKLLVATPPVISSTMFVTVVHMLAIMCSTCPDLAVQLLNLNIADTLCNLLVAINQGASFNIELTPRTPQELYEIVCLIGELMPRLPTDGIFSVDQLLRKSSPSSGDGVTWHWMDDLGVWHPYSLVDCRIIESALQSGEHEVNLCIFGVNYAIDFETSQQINEDTGTTRHIKRKMHNSPASTSQPACAPSKVDAREEVLKNNTELGDSFIKTLFCVLYEVYNSSAGPSIRHKCLQALMRIIYYGNAKPLKSVLPTCNVSSHIAAMMASTDLKIVVVGVQMAFVLMEKLPEVFNIHFCREGVMHQIKKLREIPSTATNTSSSLTLNDSRAPASSLEVMDLSTSTSAGQHQQLQQQLLQQQHVVLNAPSNSNHNNIGSVAVAVAAAGPSRATRSSGFPQQSLLTSLVPPPPQSSFRQTPFLHMPSHLPPSFSLPPPPPPYPSFHIFHEPSIEFPPPPPLPSNHTFFAGQMGGTNEGVNVSTALGSTGRTSPVSPRLSKLSNVLKHKKVSSRRFSGGKTGRGIAFAGATSMAQMAPHIGPTPTGVSLILGGNNHPQSHHQSIPPQVFQPTGYYTPTQSQIPPQQQTPLELQGLLGEVEPSAPLRTSKWSSSKSPNFLGGLKWNRSANRQPDRPASPLPHGSMGHPGTHPTSHQQIFFPSPASSFALASNSVGTPVNTTANDIKERVRIWISEQATKFCEKYYGQDNSNSPTMSALSCLNQLCAANNLLLDELKGMEGLEELSKIMMEEDVSPFEMIHSGILTTLLSYLTPIFKLVKGGKSCIPSSSLPVESKISDADMLLRYERAKTFLTVFLRSPKVAEGESILLNTDAMDTRPFQSIVFKLMACFHHLEQFQVKVHDLPAGASSMRGGNNAIRFFDTHQIKCNLQRHPSCTTLKQWRGGPVKIDPLALVQAIERYLLMRGFAKTRQSGDEDDEDEDDDASDDDDIDEGLSVPSTSQQHHGNGGRRQQQQSTHQQQSGLQHSIEFVLNDHVLPYNMTVYEAVRQYGNHSSSSSRTGGVTSHESETEADWESTFGANCIWTNTHTIYYRPATEGSSTSLNSTFTSGGVLPNSAISPKKTKSDKSKNKGGSKAIKDLDLGRSSSLDQALDPQHILSSLTFKDPSLQVLPLLSIMHALNRHWGILFEKMNAPQLLGSQDFSSSKLTSKANRQLQDPLSIMTGNIPSWLGQIARTCSFLLPFETRQLLFYATAFDRDRAMHRVQRESNQDQGSSLENNDRVVPRLERRKATISRDDILKQAEKLISDMNNYKALLEIQYENEVGTGLGPTMEFYALVSRELQRHELELWNGEPVSSSQFDVESSMKNVQQQQKQSTSAEQQQQQPQQQYTFSPCGLFPSPLPRSMKANQVNKVKAKFKFLGKFMAKALMDSRMLDIPLSKSLYKWMLTSHSSRQSLGLTDLENVLPMISKFVQQLLDVLKQKRKIESDPSHTPESRHLALNSLTVDGSSVDNIDIDFCLPGFPNIEMKKGGKDTMLSLHNIDEYLKLVVHWVLHEGPGKQLDALKEGFESIFPLSFLSLFYPEEMELLFCGNNFESWTPRYLSECCRIDHGYTAESQPIKFLFEALSSFNSEEQRLFVQFTTGSPRLPVGGLKSLNPPLTIVRKAVENNDDPDNYLPSVMTCVNYFKLPEYTSLGIAREKLLLAAREGQKSFHLS